MKLAIKIFGVSSFILILVVSISYFYITSTFLDFEDSFADQKNLKELKVGGYTFLDRNSNGKLDNYEDSRKSIESRVEDLMSQITIEEKIHLLKGSGMASAMGFIESGKGIPGVVGTIVPTPRLGLPAINLSDGPAGLRILPNRPNDSLTYYCTAFPIGTLLASTWNVDLVKQVGIAMGDEALEYGVDVILGPGANIHRHPLCGRNFEYYSEDPVLTGNIGSAMVNGIQSKGIGASVKHFVANNQETNRNNNDVIISERAMREIYLKGFEIIIKKSNPWSIMSSYNKVNGIYVAESKELLTDILREDWNFKGLVMSDWFGGINASAMIMAGNDLLEPGTNSQWKALKKGYKNGDLSIKAIDASVKRILKLIIGSKKMQQYEFNEDPDLEDHAKTARKSASEGMILLKNEETLPIQKMKNIALFGVTSYDLISGGTGSGDVNEAYSVSLEEGLKNAGYSINENAKKVFQVFKSENKEGFLKKEGLEAMIDPYSPPEIKYIDSQLKQIVSSTDIAIVTIGRNSGEGGDRKIEDDFILSNIEKENINNICDIFHNSGKKVVVVLNIGGVIETASWKTNPDAILLAWQGGQEGGNGLADILSGKVNPSAKLPMTFPINLEDHESNKNMPLEGTTFNPLKMLSFGNEKPLNKKIKDIDFTKYEEGVYVGYRHFDKSILDVSFPFGYGLSYTDFKFSRMNVTQNNDSIKISLKIKNIGDFKGKEVVQLYVSKLKSNIDRPINELKAFQKTSTLKPSQSETLILKILISNLAYWDEKKSKWIIEKGTYQLNLGTSSRDIKESVNIEI